MATHSASDLNSFIFDVMNAANRKCYDALRYSIVVIVIDLYNNYQYHKILNKSQNIRILVICKLKSWLENIKITYIYRGTRIVLNNLETI